MSIKRLAVWTLLAIDFLIVSYMVFLTVRPYRVISIVGQDQILNTSKTVRPGEALVYEITYCKYTQAQAAVTRTLDGDVNYPLPASTNNVPTGCRKAISRNTIVPIGVQPGVYHLELKATYKVNPLRSITVTSRTEDFTVVALDASSSPVSASNTHDVAQRTLDPVVVPAASTVVTEPSPTPVAVASQPSLLDLLVSVLRTL